MPRRKHKSNDSVNIRVANLSSSNAKSNPPQGIKILEGEQRPVRQPLTSREMSARNKNAMALPSSKTEAPKDQVQAVKKFAVTTSGGFKPANSATKPLFFDSDGTPTSSFSARTASGDAYSSGSVSMGGGGNFYSPQLSTDFLEKPQNLRERRAWYRHFYNSNEIVHSAVDLHSTIPLSRIRLQKPKAKNPHLSEYSYKFFNKMIERLKMLRTLLEISHDYQLLGNCLTGEMEVRTPDGYKPIADLSVTDKVLTHTGKYRPIEVLMSRVGESIYNLSFGGDYKNLRLTGEHPVEVLKDGSFVFTDAKDVVKGDYVRIVAPSEVNDVLTVDYLASVPSFIEKTETGYTRTVDIKRNRNAEPTRVRKLLIEWLEALSEPVIRTRDDLSAEFNCSTRVLDHVVNTLSAEAETPFIKRIGAPGYQKGSQVEWYPTAIGSLKAAPEYGIVREEMFVTNTSIPVDNDLLYLIGYWLGDGTLARDSSREGVWGRGLWHIYFGEESSDKLSKVMGIIRSTLGEQCLKVWKDDRLVTTVKVGSNPAFVEWWASNFGETSFGTNAKRIPQWVQELPSDKLMSLVAGLVDSDGSVGINTNSNSLLICLQLSSPTLIDQVRDVMLKCSCLVLRNHAELPQETMDAPIVGRICNKHKDVYKLLCSDEDSCKKILQYTLKQPKGAFRFTGSSTVAKRIGNDFALIVKNVEVQPGEVVYNLQVAVDHTFTVNGFSTHNCFSFVEDHDPYANLPKDAQEALKAKGKAQSDKLLKEFNITDKDPNYIGWTKILVLPPDQVRVTKIPFADNPLIEYVPDPETIAAIMKFEESHGDAFQGLNESSRPKVPSSILSAVSEGGAIPLDQDPYSGSFIYHLARKKSQYEVMGVSTLECCINTLLVKDKLRQAQTSIASRHMTPIRVVSAEQLSDQDVDDLRTQIDMALMDPDYSIVSNYQITWDEHGSNQRLLELTTEYDQYNNELFTGLGVTRELMTGESTYSGSKLSMEILNIQYLLYREQLQEFVEKFLFEPVARRKGFIEVDEYGEEHVIYPKFTFTRMSIRDNDSVFEQVFQLYQKGSVPVDTVLELLGLDADLSKVRIEEDLFTVNDSSFNALLNGAYQAAANDLVTKSNLTARAAKALGLESTPAPAEGDAGAAGGGGDAGGGALRFANEEMKEIMRLAGSDPEKLKKVLAMLQEPSA